jgi:hypothetical protein
MAGNEEQLWRLDWKVGKRDIRKTLMQLSTVHNTEIITLMVK